MKRAQLFLITSFLAGLGGALGSMVGNAFGRTGLWVGGVLGGLIGAHAAVAVSKGRGWIAPQQFHFTVAGAALGFLIAAGIAVNTLSSPVGPLLSSAVPGLGALLGAHLAAKK